MISTGSESLELEIRIRQVAVQNKASERIQNNRFIAALHNLLTAI